MGCKPSKKGDFTAKGRQPVIYKDRAGSERATEGFRGSSNDIGGSSCEEAKIHKIEAESISLDQTGNPINKSTTCDKASEDSKTIFDTDETQLKTGNPINESTTCDKGSEDEKTIFDTDETQLKTVAEASGGSISDGTSELLLHIGDDSQENVCIRADSDQILALTHAVQHLYNEVKSIAVQCGKMDVRLKKIESSSATKAVSSSDSDGGNTVTCDNAQVFAKQLQQTDGAHPARSSKACTMEELHCCVLRNCRMTLLKDMHKVSDILDYLVNHGVFTSSMQADIMAERTERDKVRKMLDDLTRRGPKVWPKFIAGLRHKDVGFGHLADMLEQEEKRLRCTSPGVPYPLLTVDPVGPKQGEFGLRTIAMTKGWHPIQQPNDQTTVKHLASQISHQIAETGQQLSITQCDESVSMDTDEVSPPLLQTAYQRCDPDERYRMESNPRGYMLIINNIEFTKATTRDGSFKDQQALVELFVHKLGFKVEIRVNLTGREMLETLEDFSKLDIHEKADSCAVAILTHGDANGTLHGVDMEAVSMNRLQRLFSSSTCERLRGKPKLFLIQACRGTGGQGGGAEQASGNSYQRDHAVTVDADPGTVCRIPDLADMLFAYSTTEGSVACRHPDEGSWFIQHFVKVFRDRSDNTNVTDLLIRVNNEVHKHHNLRNSGLMQIPAPVVMLTKTWYLNPPSAGS